MRKPVYTICEQQRRRSACAFAQYDQPAPLDSKISRLAISKISRPYLVSVVEQAGLSLTWSQTPKTGFLMTWFKQCHKSEINVVLTSSIKMHQIF